MWGSASRPFVTTSYWNLTGPVEFAWLKWKRVVRKGLAAACVRPVDQDMIVVTRNEQISNIRKILIEQFLAHAPDSEILLQLGEEYGADKDRFEKQSTFCILCGLCVRYCTEVKKKNAIGFFDRGSTREIKFIPEIAAKECKDCKECFPLCPTSYLQAAYHLTEALAFPSFSSAKSASRD